MSDEMSGGRSTGATRQFTVQAMTEHGEEITLTVSAASREDAISIARKQGTFPTTVEESSERRIPAAPNGSSNADTHQAAKTVGGGGRRVVGAVMIGIGILLWIYFGLLS